MVFTILSSVSQNERNRIRERVRDVKQHRLPPSPIQRRKRPSAQLPERGQGHPTEPATGFDACKLRLFWRRGLIPFCGVLGLAQRRFEKPVPVSEHRATTDFSNLLKKSGCSCRGCHFIPIKFSGRGRANATLSCYFASMSGGARRKKNPSSSADRVSQREEDNMPSMCGNDAYSEPFLADCGMSTAP